ncbi:MAG: HNH endonuclease [Thermosipho sp. (in: Bacteria)]|nr:HNH endonuclease [Thermosipho sp. (in: thermotogales)]
MGQRRKDPPEPIKRKLRQEAGFGCCKCGFPIYDYHHIIKYSVEHHFRAEDMMLLCPNCHREATVGAMTEEEQCYYKANPFNIRRGYVEGLLKVNQKEMVISTGGIQFVNDGFIIMVDEEPLLTLKNSDKGTLEISLTLFDRDDNLLAIIDRNQWVAGDPTIWDIEFGYQWLIMRRKSRDIRLHIDARCSPLEIRADLYRKGQFFRLNKAGLIFNGIISNVSMKDLCYVGMYLHADTKTKQFSIRPDERFGKGVIISWADVQERINKGLNALKSLKEETIG